MNEKEFHTGIIVGRFQPFHNGHEYMIRTALEMCDRVLVFVGSAQESRTTKNPFTYQVRKCMIIQAFPEEYRCGQLYISPLYDIGAGNTTEWGDFVARRAKDELGEYPQVIISGFEERRILWFDEKLNIREIYLERVDNISSTKLRESLLSGDTEYWLQHTNPEINKNNGIKFYRELLIMAQGNTETDSV